MFKTILGAIGASTALLCGHAAAAPITLNAGDSAIFNFAGPGVAAAKMDVSGYLSNQTMTGTTAYYAGFNLSGGLVYTDSDPTRYASQNTRSDSALLDGFSILISVVTGSFEIDPKVTYYDASLNPVHFGTGTTGFDSNATTGTPSVPEPGSLLLVVLAGLALTAARTRRAT